MASQKMEFKTEYRQKLFDRIEKRSKSFFTIFNATLIFAYAFLAFILIPLVGLHHDEKKYNDISADYKQKTDWLEKEELKIQPTQEELDRLSQTRETRNKELEEKIAVEESIRIKLEEIELQIEKNTSESELNKEKTIAFFDIKERFSSLPSYDTRQSANKLRDSLARMSENAVTTDDLSGLDADDSCKTALDINDYVKCKTKETIEKSLAPYRSIIADADRELSGYVELGGAEQIDDRINRVLAVLEEKLRQQPDFWRTYRGKTFFFKEFEQPIQSVFEETNRQMEQYRNTLDEKKQRITQAKEYLDTEGLRLDTLLTESRKRSVEIAAETQELEKEILLLNEKYTVLEKSVMPVRAEIEKMKTEIDSLQNIIIALPKLKEDIEKRLESVRTPFGPIPVGLNEAILAFPVLVAAGIFIYLFTLVDLMRLRKTYQQQTREQYPETAEKIRDDMMLIAPLWLDPTESRGTVVRHLIYLCLPGLAFFIGFLLIIYNWVLTGPQTASTVTIRMGYTVLYLAGVIILTNAARRLFAARREMAGR